MALTLVCDLDGVVYLGATPIPGAADAIERARKEGARVVFATNNSARPPGEVVDKLMRTVGVETTVDTIVTSSIVAAGLVREGPVLVVGEAGVVEAIEGAGFDVTDEPARAATVVVGLDRGFSYEKVASAARAIRLGAHFIVTNRDSTFPTDRGLLPGAGACVAAVETAAGAAGETAGKPSPNMRRHIERMAGVGPIWMVGDREDTDIALAVGDRWSSALVTTGVTTPAEAPGSAATLVAADLGEAVQLILERHGR